MKSKVIFDPVYRTTLVFITDSSLTEANKKLKRMGLGQIPSEIYVANGTMHYFDEEDYPKRVRGRIYLVWVKKNKDLVTLIHELSHLTIAILTEKGLPITDDNASSEAFAYYHQFWFTTLWEFMNKK